MSAGDCPAGPRCRRQVGNRAPMRPRPWNSSRDAGFTLIEIVVAVGIVGVLAAIGIPSLLRARATAHEGSAIASLRAISSAQAAYQAQGGGGGYATALAALGRSCPGSSEPFISPDLAVDPTLKGGYQVALQPAAAATAAAPDCNGTATSSDYYATAVPISTIAGQRAFASNAHGTIFFDPSGVAPTEAAMAPGGGATPIH